MRNRLWVALFAAVVLSSFGCKEEPAKDTKASGEVAKEAFGRLTIEQLEAKLADAKAGKGEVYIYDNNGKERFEKGHIPGAKLVAPDQVAASNMPPSKDATLVFYCGNEQCSACHSGASAALALGYKNVFILPVGIAGWEKAGKPLEKGNS